MRWSTVAALLLLAGPALAQGARYVGPVSEIPPDLRQPSDWPPPDTSGSGPMPPCEFMQNGDGVTLRPGQFSYESWRFAWHLRENGVVEARAREFRGMPRLSGEALSARVVEERILPVLREAAAADVLGSEICSAALLGLVRAGDEAALGLFRTTARNRGIERRSKTMEEVGVLALGWAEDGLPENAAILRTVVENPVAKCRSRSLACVALAQVEGGNPSLDTLRLLESALFSEGDGRPFWPDDSVAAAFALGRLESAEAAGILRRFLDAPPPDDRERKALYPGLRMALLRSHAAASLGRAAAASGDEGAVGDAFRTLESVSRRDGILAVQGAVLGLGSLGAGPCPETAAKCARRLEALLESDSTEAQARRFAALALSRIAARGPGGARDHAMKVLLDALASACPTPSWAALAAGFAGEGRTAGEREDIARAVRKAWDAFLPRGTRVVEDRGGCLVALGLLRDPSAAPLLEGILADGGEDADLRGYAATALGLLGDPAAIPALRVVLKDRGERPWRRPVVVALGLLGDSESVPAILEVMKDPKSSRFILGGCAQALGFLRDGNAADPLLEIAADEKYPDLTRAMALQALSRMAAGVRPDPFADLTEGVPYRACTDALIELWSIL